MKNATLKTCKGFPHGMCATAAETIDTDLLAFCKSQAQFAAAIVVTRTGATAARSKQHLPDEGAVQQKRS